jgi:hypothetical protein
MISLQQFNFLGISQAARFFLYIHIGFQTKFLQDFGPDRAVCHHITFKISTTLIASIRMTQTSGVLQLRRSVMFIGITVLVTC